MIDHNFHLSNINLTINIPAIVTNIHIPKHIAVGVDSSFIGYILRVIIKVLFPISIRL